MDRSDVLVVTTQGMLSAQDKAYIVRVMGEQFRGSPCVVKDGRDLAKPEIPQQQPQRDNGKGKRR